jgi:PEP-CTERM motif
MRTKTILGLVAGLMAVAQIASAQGTNSRQAYYNKYDSDNSIDWMNLDSSPGSLSAMTPFAPMDSGSEFAMNTPMDNNADGVLRGEDKVGGDHGGHVPLMASPEPGTISLLVMGGAAMAGALRRRKNS